MKESPKESLLELNVIQTNNAIYINEESPLYYSLTTIPNLYFDGEKALKTYKEKWAEEQEKVMDIFENINQIYPELLFEHTIDLMIESKKPEYLNLKRSL